jgi:hypothetical protein
MGIDISSFVEKRVDDKWKKVTEKIFPNDDSYTEYPFSWRSYGMYGFLANVKNYSHVPCITTETRGLPVDSEYLNETSEELNSVLANITITRREDLLNNSNNFGYSYIYLYELLNYDYNQVFEDRRCSRNGNGAAVAEVGKGIQTTVKDFLGSAFFKELEILKTIGEPKDVRVLMWFN